MAPCTNLRVESLAEEECPAASAIGKAECAAMCAIDGQDQGIRLPASARCVRQGKDATQADDMNKVAVFEKHRRQEPPAATGAVL